MRLPPLRFVRPSASSRRRTATACPEPHPRATVPPQRFSRSRGLHPSVACRPSPTGPTPGLCSPCQLKVLRSRGTAGPAAHRHPHLAGRSLRTAVPERVGAQTVQGIHVIVPLPVCPPGSVCWTLPSAPCAGVAMAIPVRGRWTRAASRARLPGSRDHVDFHQRSCRRPGFAHGRTPHEVDIRTRPRPHCPKIGRAHV